MRSSYAIAQPWILAYEGDYVDHPKDPGGATMEGITQRTYDADRRRRGLAVRSVRHLSAGERDAIYKTQYWDAVRGDDLPAGVDAAVYDYAVNSGPSRAAKELQAVLGVAQDGVIGIMTLDAAKAANPFEVIRMLCDRRMAFLKRLSHWGTFGRGWTRRVMGDQPGIQDADTGIVDRATRLARGMNSIPGPKIRDDGAGEVAAPTATSSFFAAIVKLLLKLFQRKSA